MKSLRIFSQLRRPYSNFQPGSLASRVKRVEEEPKPLTEKEINEKKRNGMFNAEQKRQEAKIGRIEKIEVQYKGLPEETTLLMNKCLSTPYDCAKHMSETIVGLSALARVNGQLWDMHRPFEGDCELEFLTMKDADPYHANKAFWRSCSVILGAVAQNAFKDRFGVNIHSFPSPNVKTGSFIYDVQLDMPEWHPTHDELKVLSAQFVNMAREELKFERLVVDAEFAEEIFFDNPHKLEQIPQIATQLSDDNKITLYRIGNHVDISRGPMVGDTGFVGRATVTAVHKLDSEIKNLYRFQGVALPKGFIFNHFAYGILESRAAKLNKSWIPGTHE
ncbi:large ribosomal subunit protein mL39 [Neocloeon triangulifer]|uniref:large ribosomal subunit protein mL39 n=1 Tax=Neocloeon triangulifer TaxID=2078957 RepID=UPI00286F3CC4|nr:large ribosomal subunit protein mL39 [Neocloeon triangulifer]